MKVLYDWLKPGQIPIYDQDPDTQSFILYNQPAGRYVQRAQWVRAGRRLIVSVIFDVVLPEIPQYLTERLDELQVMLDALAIPGPRQEAGTLFFPVRTIGDMGRGQEVCFGMAWMECECEFGEHVDDPIGHICRLVGDPTYRERMKDEWLLEAVDAQWDMIGAEARSRELLLSYLNPIQKAQFEKTGEFTVRSPFGHRFLITASSHLNIYRLGPGNKRVARYCVVVDEAVPLYDSMLAQKMLIEADPIRFHETANVCRYEERDYKVDLVVEITEEG